MFDDIAKEIALRQYAQPHETSVEEIFERAATVIDSVPSILEDQGYLSGEIKQAMVDKRFCPGGRILAGAGTDHGNLLNCFVQDGHNVNEKIEDKTKYALNLAKKLALVTKVGGGNGVNLDVFPGRRSPGLQYARLPIFLATDDPDVKAGRFLDLVTGERKTYGYKALRVLDPGDVINVESPDDVVEIKVPDDTAGIWDAAAQMVLEHQRGKVVIVDVSSLRPEGSTVRGSGGTSSGPASFAVEIFDNFARWAKLGGGDYAGPVATLRYVLAPTLRVIRQGGVRRGAGMATLSAEHPDIEDFLTSKDLRREQREGDISTFNISVLISDRFMRAVERDEYSKESILLDKIAEHAWDTGEPGLLYVDTINKNNLLYERDGPILATNPCGEIGLYPGEPCDLGAVNVSAYFNMGDEVGSSEWHWALERILNDSFMYAEYLDLILDAEKSPLPEIEEAIKSKRRIGLGMMGLGDALIKLGIRYGSAESFTVAHELAKRIRQGAEEYTYSAHPIPTLPGDRRNVALVTVAPTGTTAMVMGTTSGIEPLFAPFIYRRVGTEYKQILHPLFKEMMEQFKPSSYFCTWKPVRLSQVIGSTPPPDEQMYVPDQWDWSKVTGAIVENHGSVQGIVGIPQEVQHVFACAHDIEPLEHVRMQAAVQEAFDYQDDQPTYVGNSISKTINMPETSTWQDVREVYRQGWRHQLKGITVYVDGSRDLQVLNTSMEDDGSTAKSQAQDEQLQEIIAASCSLEDGSCDL